MRWLFIIDPLNRLHKNTDTTYPIMKESIGRKIDTFIAEIGDLFFDKKAMLLAQKIDFKTKIAISNKEPFLLDEFDLIFMRKEPPYNYAFHYATQLLSFCGKKVVNSPQSLRNFNEKLIALNFPELIPDTLVSSNLDHIIKFIKKFSEFAVIKALDSYQGKSVNRVRVNDKNLENKIAESTKNGKIPVMVQQFLPNIVKGDKRILVLGTKILGAVNRIPKDGSYLSNFGQGGSGHKTEVTEREQNIVERLAPFFKKNGIHFAGLDVIDNYLTEINITCPTGLQHINRLENKKLEIDVVDYFVNFTASIK